jgi:hypothetical protein
MEKRDEFDSSGETQGYISLDQAGLDARRLARQDEERYRQRLGWDQIVWTESSAEQREDSYRVVLQFRRPTRGLREEQTGEEEFIFDLTGKLQDRQVLLWPEGELSGAGFAPATSSPPVEAPPASYVPPRREEYGDGMMFPPFQMIGMCMGILTTLALALKRLVAQIFGKNKHKIE